MTDLWTYLKNTEKPIVMYGMGNGADKILERFEEYGIEVSDFFASDGFVRGHFFHGKRVMSLREIKEKYEDFIIILSFASSLDEVLVKFYDLNKKYEMYAPDVPVTGSGTFNSSFYDINKDKIEKARSILADVKSREVFDNIIEYKLSGRIDLLKASDSDPEEVFENILSPEKYNICIDAGAYNGDTAKEMIARFPNVKTIYALEPDQRNFKKLTAFAETDGRTVPLNAAAWNENTVLEFDNSGNRNSNTFSTGKKTVKTEAVCIDTVCGCVADYVKFDVEGAEKYALEGCIGTIKKSSPDMLISVYHRNEDIFELPLLIHKIAPDHKLYLRKFKYVPAWDLNLYAIK